MRLPELRDATELWAERERRRRRILPGGPRLAMHGHCWWQHHCRIPLLATTPRAPLAPPVPLPEPGPTGISNPPACAMLMARVCVVFAGMPLGSPKPPVCTLSGARRMVCGAELPVEKLLSTTGFGMTGAVEGIGSSFLVASFTSGATASSTLGLGCGRGAGKRSAAGGGSSAATKNRPRKLALGRVIHRLRSGHQRDVIILRRACKNFRMQNRNPDQNSDHDGLHSVTQNQLRPRRLPPRKRREQA